MSIQLTLVGSKEVSEVTSVYFDHVTSYVGLCYHRGVRVFKLLSLIWSMWYLSQRSLQAPYSLRDLHIYYVYCLNILNRHSSFGAYVYV